MRIYISGAITLAKHPEKDFDRAERYLRELFPAAEIINPYALGKTIQRTARLSWTEYMSIDFLLMKMCDTVYFIRGWEKSEGCRQEWIYAENLGLDEVRITAKGVTMAPLNTRLKRAEVV